eukprot:CAMPEP_0114554794 /NCGR_PEP_ID=MMETSP0114-20121206/8401_1 /TAXON_ID=31324 /ORGANISM="Goniomonas sp, Strain m" /LENGTH=100 /DNA_ID=CAMNT_0001739867 /DNA_START=192 /DNA_END=494 /DNA_ORIENTATION=+
MAAVEPVHSLQLELDIARAKPAHAKNFRLLGFIEMHWFDLMSQHLFECVRDAPRRVAGRPFKLDNARVDWGIHQRAGNTQTNVIHADLWQSFFQWFKDTW